MVINGILLLDYLKEQFMKILLTNYDASEYLLFQERLNNLSKQGYNCKSVDYFTVFKKDDQQCFYKTDIFVPDKTKKEKNHQQRDKWLLNYVNRGYEFIGKSGKIYVFKSPNKINYSGTKQSLLDTYFKKNRTLINITLIFISIFLTYLLVPSVFTNQDPSEFVTNGSIILHYVPLLFCISLLSRFFVHYVNTEKLKNKTNKQKAINKNQQLIFTINNWLFILSILLIIAGFSLDYLQRKTKTISKQVITLETLGYLKGDNNDDTCITSHSFLIKEAISYNENNGDQIIKVNYYQYSNSHKADKALNNYLSSNQFAFTKEINNGYLLSNDSVYNIIAFVKEKQLIIVQTNFDLQTDNKYQTIIKQG